MFDSFTFSLTLKVCSKIMKSNFMTSFHSKLQGKFVISGLLICFTSIYYYGNRKIGLKSVSLLKMHKLTKSIYLQKPFQQNENISLINFTLLYKVSLFTFDRQMISNNWK